MIANETLKTTAREIIKSRYDSPIVRHVKQRLTPLMAKLDDTGTLSKLEIYELWVFCSAMEKLGFEVPTEEDLQPWLKGFKPSSLKH